MDEAIRYEGYWWLPGQDGNGVPGILEFDPDKGADLRLMGSLKGLEDITDPLEPEIIQGLSSDGKRITLKDCAKILGNLRFGGGFSTSTFAANAVFVGEHFERSEDVGFERLVVEYLHLGAWADASGFDIKFFEERKEPKRRWIKMKHELPEAATAQVGSEYEVTLDFGADFEASQRPLTWATIKQPAELAIKFTEKQPFDRLRDVAFRLQHLLSLGMRRSAYPVAIRGYTGAPGDAMQVEVHYSPLGRMDDVERPERFEMLFSRRNLPGGFEVAVARWLERAGNLDPVYRLFLGAVYNPRLYLEQRFLSLVQAMEVYHRRAVYEPDLPEVEHEKRVEKILDSAPAEHKGWLRQKLRVVSEPSLDQRLHEILKRHRGITNFVVGSKGEARAEFVEKVVVTRNYRTHFDENKKGKAARGQELYQITRKLNLLLEACLMEEIGFGPEETKDAVLGTR
jgi:hypothetical protein